MYIDDKRMRIYYSMSNDSAPHSWTMIRQLLDSQRSASSRHALAAFAPSAMPKRTAAGDEVVAPTSSIDDNDDDDNEERALVYVLVASIDVLERKYGARSFVSSGVDGLVYRLGERRALKLFVERSLIESEATLMLALADYAPTREHVAQVYGVYELTSSAELGAEYSEWFDEHAYNADYDEPPSTLYGVVYDFFAGTTIHEYATRASVVDRQPNALRPIVESAVRAVRALHTAGVVHNDVHSGNILIGDDRRTVRLIDFARACVAPDTPIARRMGAVAAAEFACDDVRSDVYVAWSTTTPQQRRTLTDDARMLPSAALYVAMKNEVFEMGVQLAALASPTRYKRAFTRDERTLYEADTTIDAALRSMCAIDACLPAWPALPLVPAPTGVMASRAALSSSPPPPRRRTGVESVRWARVAGE